MEFIAGNIFVRPMHFEKAGQVIEGHAHNFDHTTYVIRGAIRVETPFEQTRRVVEKRASDGHNWLLIRAGVAHKITALEDDTEAHCIYAHRNPQGEVVQEYDGWTRGYV